MKHKEINRTLNTDKPQIRAEGEGDKKKNYIEGYAILFNQRSKLIREWGEVFYEIIEPGAPDNILRDKGLNVIATIDHDPSRMLGRTKSGTLSLKKDTKGVRYKIEIPETQLGRDIAALIERGDYYESSFIFTIAEKGLRYDRSEDIPVRYVSDFEDIRDVSIVIDAAYANTAVQLRSNLFNVNEEPEKPKSESGQNPDILEKELQILNLK